jgi:O-antigen/teichoic acid export membrane protein
MHAIAQLQPKKPQKTTEPNFLSSRVIVAAMTQLGGLQVILALTGFVRNKVAAIYLKTAGIGEWSQILGVATTVFLIVQFGMIVGLSRNTAAAKDQKDRQRQLSVANTLTTVIAIATILVALALSRVSSHTRLLSGLGISTGQGLLMLLFIAALAPIEGFRNNYLSFLQGTLDIRGIATKRAIAVILATLAAIPLVSRFGIMGACLQFALASVLLAALLGHRCHQLGYRPIQFQWERSSAVGLATLGGASLLVSFAYGLADVLIRSQMIRFVGLSETGIYQAAFLLSSQVTQIALGSIGVFSLASISRSTIPEVISHQLHAMYRVILPTSAVGLGLLGLLERPAVQLLFSSQFNSSTIFLPLLLVGNATQAACWVAGAPLLGCGRVRTWLALQIVGASIRYLLVTTLLPVIGTQAIPLAFLLGQLFDLIASIIVCSRYMQISTSRADLAKIAFSSGLPGALALIGLHPTPAAFGAGAIVLIVGAVILMPFPPSRFALVARGAAISRYLPFKTKTL